MKYIFFHVIVKTEGQKYGYTQAFDFNWLKYVTTEDWFYSTIFRVMVKELLREGPITTGLWYCEMEVRELF